MSVAGGSYSGGGESAGIVLTDVIYLTNVIHVMTKAFVSADIRKGMKWRPCKDVNSCTIQKV